MPSVTLPSVTTILAAVGLTMDYRLIPADVLATASERGTLVHAAVHDDVYHCLDESALPPAVMARFIGWQRFLKDTGYRPIVAEATVTSARWGFIGHLDGAGWLGADRTLLDLKCVAKLDPATVAYQLGGYDIAWSEQRPREPFKRYLGLQLLPDRYKVHDLTARMANARTVFQAAVIVFKAQRGMTYREFSESDDPRVVMGAK